MATGGLNGKISGLDHLQTVPTKRWCSRRKSSYQPLIPENRKHDHNHRRAALRTGTHAAFHQGGIRSARSKQKPRACPAASFFLPLLMMPGNRKERTRENKHKRNPTGHHDNEGGPSSPERMVSSLENSRGFKTRTDSPAPRNRGRARQPSSQHVRADPSAFPRTATRCPPLRLPALDGPTRT